MPSPTDPIPVRTYEIVGQGNSLMRIDIPESWKVTYGPVVGPSKDGATRTMAFRAWEAETRQRLMITEVTSFRDVSLPVTMKAIRPYGWTTWHMYHDEWIGEHAEKVELAWKPIDEISETVISPGDLGKKDKAPEAEPEPDGWGRVAVSWKNPPPRRRP